MVCPAIFISSAFAAPTAASWKLVADHASSATPTAPPPALTALLRVFLVMGMSSFGGGLSGWMHREIVEKRRWLTNERFLAGVAMGQVLPGPNSANLALYIGLHLRGGLGAFVCAFGLLTPPFLFILLLGVAYTQFSVVQHAHFIFSGMAAAGVGMTMVTTVKVARILRGFQPFVIAAVTFVTIGIRHLPLIPVALVLIPASIVLAYRGENADD
jgi:chromate transporter